MAITSWTDVVSTFVYATATPYATGAASAQYVTGGPANPSEIRQDVAVVSGYEYGQAVLTFARANVLATDGGAVTIEALSAASAVLASVTTGFEAFVTLNTWYRRRLALTLPALTATIRVRLEAKRTLGAGNSGAAFDDLDLRVFKHADPMDVADLDFRTLPTQPIANTWQLFHLAWPTLAIPTVIGFGDVNLSQPIAIAGRVLGTSDGNAIVPGVLTAPFASATPSAPCYNASRAGQYVTVTGGTPQLGAFTSADAFTVRVVLRTDEPTWGTTAGVVGRIAAGNGWSISITATGFAQATLVGAGGTKTATSAAVVNDGAPHALVLVHDAAADTLRIYVDRRGYVETSTATGLGEFALASQPLHLGRAAASSNGLPGQILECQLIPAALTQAQIEAMWRIGADPSGLVTTYSRSAVGWCGGGYDASGATLAAHATDQLAIGYVPGAATWGLACGINRTNVITSWDLSTWTRDASATYAAITDCTGLARGARFGVNATNGVRIATSTLTAIATVRVAFWAKATAAASVNVVLKTSAGAAVQTVAVALTTTWARYDVAFTAWAGATTTALVEWIGATGAVTLDLAHVVGVFQSSATTSAASPMMIPRPAASFSAGVTAVAARIMAQQFTAEGEVDATFACLRDETTSMGVLWCGQVATPSVVADSKHGRELVLSAGAVDCLLYPGNFNASPAITLTPAAAGAIDLATAVRVRARWRRVVGLPEDSTKISSASITVGGTTTTVTSTTAIADDATLAVDNIKLGAEAVGAQPFAGVIARVLVKAAPARL